MSQRVGELLSSLEPDALESVRVNATGDAWETFLPMDRTVYDTDGDGIVDTAERIEIIVRVRSSDYPSGLTKGTVVYIGGATGNRPYVLKADASDESTSSKTLGIVVADIAGNADGTVAINGTLHDLALPTTTYTDGDSLWLSETAGQFVVNTPPAEPAHSVFIGWVARAHPTQGRIVLHIQNGYELNELHGVKITGTPANGEVLTYQTSTGLWENARRRRSLYQTGTTVEVEKTASDVLTVSIPAGLMSANGDAIKASIFGSNVDPTCKVEFWFGGTKRANYDTLGSGQWTLDIELFRSSNTTMNGRFSLIGENGGLVDLSLISFGSINLTTTAYNFVIRLDSTAGDIIDLRTATVEFLPSP